MTTADPVIVNGQTHPIGNGLFSALHRLRTLVCSTPDFVSSLGHPLDPIYVWADWPSLNHADEREKEIQIHRMGLIYGRAVRVVAWLGDNDDMEESNCWLLMDLARVEVPNCEFDDPRRDEGCQEALFKVMSDHKTYFVDILHSLLHDQIHGLLGITCAQDLPPEIRPDYEASFQEVYRKYSRVLFETCGDISILNRIGSGIESAPSWCRTTRSIPGS